MSKGFPANRPEQNGIKSNIVGRQVVPPPHSVIVLDYMPSAPAMTVSYQVLNVPS